MSAQNTCSNHNHDNCCLFYHMFAKIRRFAAWLIELENELVLFLKKPTCVSTGSCCVCSFHVTWRSNGGPHVVGSAGLWPGKFSGFYCSSSSAF